MNKISIKTKAELEQMRKGGQILAQTLNQLLQSIKVGTNLLDVEKEAVRLLKEAGGEPGFARVPGYHWATCINVNSEIVHGVPKKYLVKKNDLVNIDIGNYYQGFNTDMSNTVWVEPEDDRQLKKFLAVGRQALAAAIDQARAGNRVGHISQKIEAIVEGEGYSCARNLTGHGIGKQLHEPPAVPGILKGKIEDTPRLEPGMTIAVEVIYAMGGPELVVDQEDNWTIRTKDGQLSAMFEKTIAVTESEPIIITPFLS